MHIFTEFFDFILYLSEAVTLAQLIFAICRSWLIKLTLMSSSKLIFLLRLYIKLSGLLVVVAPRYRYCSGATFTVAVALAPLLLAESSADGSAATFLAAF